MIKTAPKAITQMHHFKFHSSSPGKVIAKTSSSAEERTIKLIKDNTWAPTPNQLPSVIPPTTLSVECQQYLYDKIWEFCPAEKQDIVNLPETL